MNSNPSASTVDVEAELPLVNSNAKENGNPGVRKMRSRIISAVALSLAVVGVTVLVAANKSSSSKRTTTLDLHKEDGSSSTNMKSSMGSETKLRVTTTEVKSVPVVDVMKNQKILEQAKEKIAEEEEDNEDENDRDDKGMKTSSKPVGKSAKKAAKKEAKAAKKEEKVEKKESKKKDEDSHRHLQTTEHTPESSNSIGSGALINAFAGSVKKAVAPVLTTSTLNDLDAIAASKNAVAAAENKKNLPGGLANGRGSSVSSIVNGFSTGTAQTPFAPSAAAAVPVTDASKVPYPFSSQTLVTLLLVTQII